MASQVASVRGPVAHHPPFFTDVHSYLQNMMGELSRMRETLDSNEATNQQICDDLQKDINVEVSDTREALNRFRYEFDEVVHKRVESIVDSLEELEQARKFKDRHQQLQINTQETEFQKLIVSLGGCNVTWQSFKKNSSDRANIVAQRESAEQSRAENTQSTHELSVDSIGSGSGPGIRAARRIVLAADAQQLEKSQADFEIYTLAETIRSRMKGSSQFLGGTSWERMFSEHDTDKSGRMNFQEFRVMCRVKLKLLEPDRLLRLVFESLDITGVGEISIEDMILFVADPSERMRRRLNQAVLETGGTLNRLLIESNRDRNSVLNFTDFATMCRDKLKMLDSNIHLRAIFQSIDTDRSGEITARELINWASGSGAAFRD